MKRILIPALILCSMIGVSVGSATAQMTKVEKKESSTSQKGWLGVSIQDITSEMKKAMDLDSREGALVSDVVKKSPADSAGIKEKDVIVQFGGQVISDASELQKVVADTKPGTNASVVVLRKGEKKTIDVVVGKQKESRSFTIVSPRRIKGFGVFSGAQNTHGMALRQLNDQLAKYFDVPEGTGVLVWEVAKGSAAEKAGVNAGDVISVIGKKKIKELRDVSRAMGIYDEGEKAEIEIVRKGARKTVTLEVEEGNDGEGNQFWFNEGPFRSRKESMLFHIPDVDVEVPEFNFETVHPGHDQLKIEMNDLRDHLRDNSLKLRENGAHLKEQARELREKIERELRPRISVHMSRSI